MSLSNEYVYVSMCYRKKTHNCISSYCNTHSHSLLLPTLIVFYRWTLLSAHDWRPKTSYAQWEGWLNAAVRRRPSWDAELIKHKVEWLAQINSPLAFQTTLTDAYPSALPFVRDLFLHLKQTLSLMHTHTHPHAHTYTHSHTLSNGLRYLCHLPHTGYLQGHKTHKIPYPISTHAD